MTKKLTEADFKDWQINKQADAAAPSPFDFPDPDEMDYVRGIVVSVKESNAHQPSTMAYVRVSDGHEFKGDFARTVDIRPGHVVSAGIARKIFKRKTFDSFGTERPACVVVNHSTKAALIPDGSSSGIANFIASVFLSALILGGLQWLIKTVLGFDISKMSMADWIIGPLWAIIFWLLFKAMRGADKDKRTSAIAPAREFAFQEMEKSTELLQQFKSPLFFSESREVTR